MTNIDAFGGLFIGGLYKFHAFIEPAYIVKKKSSCL